MKFRKFKINRLSATCLLAAVVGFGVPVAALANSGDGSFVSYTSQAGDYIGQGQAATFTPTDSQISANISDDQNHLNVGVNGNTWWYIDLAAPYGQKLVPGTYQGATRWPFQASNVPGADWSGDGRGCNESGSTFVVTDAVYGPAGYVERFHAYVEQHCEFATPALLGEINIVNPPPPPLMTIALTLNNRGTASRITGAATVSGTIACSVASVTTVYGALTERANRFATSSGNFYINVPCGPTPRPWSAKLYAYGAPFNPGQAQLDVTANASDPNYGTQVTKLASGIVKLDRAK